MKVFVGFLAVFCIIQATLAWTDDLPSNPDLIQCINAKTEGITVDVEGLAGWTEDVQATLSRLADQRRRCNNLPRSDPITTLQQRIIDACEAAWTASALYEGNRLKNELMKDEDNREVATQFYNAFVTCMRIDDTETEDDINLLNNIF
ncbi:unnamed protein product [Diamesa serratosioi]